MLEILLTFFTEQAILNRRSMVLSLPLQLVFRGCSHNSTLQLKLAANLFLIKYVLVAELNFVKCFECNSTWDSISVWKSEHIFCWKKYCFERSKELNLWHELLMFVERWLSYSAFCTFLWITNLRLYKYCKLLMRGEGKTTYLLSASFRIYKTVNSFVT